MRPTPGAMRYHVVSRSSAVTCRVVIRLLQGRHHWNWTDVRRGLITPTGRWRPISVGEIELRKISAIPVTRYRYRGITIPSLWGTATT